MKVVINACFGGFGLSDEALELLLQKKGIEYESQPRKVSFGCEVYEYYVKGHLGDGNYLISSYDFGGERSDPDLVAVVEEMGDQANGFASELRVVEIPDDVQWYIHEYDGLEHVAEIHRIWR